MLCYIRCIPILSYQHQEPYDYVPYVLAAVVSASTDFRGSAPSPFLTASLQDGLDEVSVSSCYSCSFKRRVHRGNPCTSSLAWDSNPHRFLGYSRSLAHKVSLEGVYQFHQSIQTYSRLCITGS